MKALQKPRTFKETLFALSNGGFVKQPSVFSKYGEVLNRNGTFLARITEHTYHELVETLSGCAKYGHYEKDLNIRDAVYHYMTINGDFDLLANKFISEELEWKKQRAKQLETT
jgi:hypothetical protein